MKISFFFGIWHETGLGQMRELSQKGDNIYSLGKISAFIRIS